MDRTGGLLLERDSELAAISDALESVHDGSGRVVLFRGAAGIGKSRMLRAAEDLARDAGVFVYTARGGELESRFAFGVARQLFEAPLQSMLGEDREDVMAGAAALATLALGVADPRSGPEGEDRLFAAMHGLYWLCANLTQHGPVLISVDDAQWADEPSLRWLAYLARRLADLPVLLVVAARSDGADRREALGTIQAEAVTTTFELGPLDDQNAAAILASLAGVQPAPEVARACHARSAGNPFVLGELASAIAQAGVPIDVAESAVLVEKLLPTSVAEIVLLRLARMDETAVSLAHAVAVLGRDVSLVDAAWLAGLEPDDAAAAMDRLVDAGLLERGLPMRFTHPLMREAIYGDVPTGRRRYQHRRAVETLWTKINAEQIAAHLMECDPVGDQESVALLRRCGARARSSGAPETAVRYLERALAEQPPDEVRGPLLRELGSAQARLGLAAAISNLKEALALAHSAWEIRTTTSELALALATRRHLTEAAATLERGIVALSGRDRELELQLMGEFGAMGQIGVLSTPQVAARMHEVAPRLRGDTVGERMVLAGYAFLRSNEMAPAAELLDLAQRALGGGPANGEEHPADTPVFYLLMYALHRAGRDDLADQALVSALADAVTRGSLLGITAALAVRGQLRWLRGELVTAEADARTSLDVQLDSGFSVVLPLAAHVLGECLLERGEADEALSLFARAGLDGKLSLSQMDCWAQATRGRARLAAGLSAEGLADLRNSEHESMGAHTALGLTWQADAAIELHCRNQVGEARVLAEEQLTRARALDQPRPLGVALRTMGVVTDGRAGLAYLNDAVTVLADSTAKLEYARALVEQGVRLGVLGQVPESRAALREGYEQARLCGATVLTERAAAALAAAGVRLRRPQLTGRDALTASELRVAEMAADGLSNPEIAQALFVSRKTIEMHLGNVYRKLTVPGRQQLADALPKPLVRPARSS